MPLKNDLSRSLAAFEQDRTLVVVLEISLSTWLVGDLCRVSYVSLQRSWAPTNMSC